MSLEISKPGQVTYLRGAVFGPPKTGKTTFACTGEGRTLLMELEPDGDLGLDKTIDAANVDVVKPNGYTEIMQVLEQMPGQYDTLVLDSVTFLSELIGGDQLAAALRSNTDPRRVYSKIGTTVNEVIRKIVALPMNTIFITQLRVEQEDEDGTPLNPEEGEFELTLAVTPMVYKILAPAVSFLGRTYKKAGVADTPNGRQRVVEYWISFEDYGKSAAGSRLSHPDRIQNPTLKQLKR